MAKELFFLLCLLLTACAPAASPTPTPPLAPAAPAAGPPRYYTFEIVNRYPHDPDAFTQGLLYRDGYLYESTGLHGRSSLRRVDLATGQVEQIRYLDDQYFGEGLALWQDRLIQLTWQSNTAFVYDRDSFAQLATFRYETEGWGLTHDGRALIMSDGSAALTFRDPDTFEPLRHLQVIDRGAPVTRLNELEYIHGEVWANVWLTDQIARIDLASGRVTGWVNLAGILTPDDLAAHGLQPADVDVLNGIAYDPDAGRLFVTGKLWPLLFEIKVVPAE